METRQDLIDKSIKAGEYFGLMAVCFERMLKKRKVNQNIFNHFKHDMLYLDENYKLVRK